MPSGSGRSLGESLVDLFGQFTRPGGVRRSYKYVGWHARLVQLTSTAAGRAALDATGLTVTARTLKAWLADTQEPNKANRERIGAAYRFMAGGIDVRHLAGRVFAIYGVVKMGRDVRDRGANGTSPLRVNGGGADQWEGMDVAWSDSTPDPDSIEEIFINDVLIPDLGEGSDPWEFPGDRYRVDI